MLSRSTTVTIGSKFIILLTNFALVVFSTNTWGSEGRGVIALVLANVSIITIFSSVFCGSTVAYHAPRVKRDSLLYLALGGALLMSLSGAILFSVLFGFMYFMPLFLISLLMALNTAVSIYWLGNKNITNYNILTILSQLLVLLSLFVLYFIFKRSDISIYYQAYYIGTGITLIIGVMGLVKTGPFKLPEFKYSEIKSIIRYGFSNEFNYFIQFLNYRLAYYFIAKSLGLAELGLFSIVVSVSEAVWIISRSMSAIHYSNVINSDDQLKNRKETIVLARQSLWISLLIIFVSVIIPQSIYRLIFGDEFGEVKKYILLLSPGIIAIAVSNLYGHYFSGTGNMNILRNKALLGLAATIILLALLLNRYQLTGVCITLNVSYIISSIYLWFKFYKE